MDMFYQEATKECDDVDECQSPGLGPTENSYDLTNFIIENEQPNEFTLQNEHTNGLNIGIPSVYQQEVPTVITNFNPTQLKLEDSANLIAQTSLASSAENPLGLSLEVDIKPNSHHRNMVDSDLEDMPQYRDKRDRNNKAVRKSRQKAKEKQIEAKKRVDFLRQENKNLENKVAQLQSELKICQSMFLNARAPVPEVLQDILKEIH